MHGLAAVALMGIVALSGCASTPTPDGGGGAEYRWLSGELATTLPADVVEVKSATLRALEELDMVAVEDAVYGPKGKVTARMADGTKVRVKLRVASAGGTEIAIRVGQIGDEPIARQVLRHIERGVETSRSGGVEE